jgi:hypothetical protein
MTIVSFIMSCFLAGEKPSAGKARRHRTPDAHKRKPGSLGQHVARFSAGPESSVFEQASDLLTSGKTAREGVFAFLRFRISRERVPDRAGKTV